MDRGRGHGVQLGTWQRDRHVVVVAVVRQYVGDFGAHETIAARRVLSAVTGRWELRPDRSCRRSLGPQSRLLDCIRLDQTRGSGRQSSSPLWWHPQDANLQRKLSWSCCTDDPLNSPLRAHAFCAKPNGGRIRRGDVVVVVVHMSDDNETTLDWTQQRNLSSRSEFVIGASSHRWHRHRILIGRHWLCWNTTSKRAWIRKFRLGWNGTCWARRGHLFRDYVIRTDRVVHPERGSEVDPAHDTTMTFHAFFGQAQQEIHIKGHTLVHLNAHTVIQLLFLYNTGRRGSLYD